MQCGVKEHHHKVGITFHQPGANGQHNKAGTISHRPGANANKVLQTHHKFPQSIFIVLLNFNSLKIQLQSSQSKKKENDQTKNI